MPLSPTARELKVREWQWCGGIDKRRRNTGWHAGVECLSHIVDAVAGRPSMVCHDFQGASSETVSAIRLQRAGTGRYIDRSGSTRYWSTGS